MIRIYIDQTINKDTHYVENDYSQFDIIETEKDEFIHIIKEKYDSVVHTCYPPFVCHVGRFHRDFGSNWAGEPVELYAKKVDEKEYTKYEMNEKGQIKHWSYGFFGD